jgi:hypothetical protein
MSSRQNCHQIAPLWIDNFATVMSPPYRPPRGIHLRGEVDHAEFVAPGDLGLEQNPVCAATVQPTAKRSALNVLVPSHRVTARRS